MKRYVKILPFQAKQSGQRVTMCIIIVNSIIGLILQIIIMPVNLP